MCIGSALNEPVHFHCVVIDGVVEAGPDSEKAVYFWEAALADADIQWVLRGLTNQGYRDRDDAKDMTQ